MSIPKHDEKVQNSHKKKLNEKCFFIHFFGWKIHTRSIVLMEQKNNQNKNYIAFQCFINFLCFSLFLCVCVFFCFMWFFWLLTSKRTADPVNHQNPHYHRFFLCPSLTLFPFLFLVLCVKCVLPIELVRIQSHFKCSDLHKVAHFF